MSIDAAILTPVRTAVHLRDFRVIPLRHPPHYSFPVDIIFYDDDGLGYIVVPLEDGGELLLDYDTGLPVEPPAPFDCYRCVYRPPPPARAKEAA
jgi:hypothetical protein